jgi:hypothetical protein
MSRDAAVATVEATMAMSKITVDKELTATKATQENNKEAAKQKEVHHPGSEFDQKHLSRIAKGSGPCIPFKKDNEKAT